MAAKYCPTCQKTFTSTERLCPDDRSVLSLNDPYHLVGRTLLDKYRIDALVGLGGMGAVYYAYHSGIDRHVAFKILQPNIAIHGTQVQQPSTGSDRPAHAPGSELAGDRERIVGLDVAVDGAGAHFSIEL